MKLKRKRLKILILITLLIIMTSLLGVYYITKPKTAPFSSGSSNLPVPLVEPAADTILLVQATKTANCTQAITQLNEAELLALPQQQFTTHHSWAAKAEVFTGPLLDDVLQLICEKPKKIILKALNDYTINLDFDYAKTLKPIVAHTVNGQRLPIRDKGPLWIMIPMDELGIPAKTLDGMLIWQLYSIVITH